MRLSPKAAELHQPNGRELDGREPCYLIAIASHIN